MTGFPGDTHWYGPIQGVGGSSVAGDVTLLTPPYPITLTSLTARTTTGGGNIFVTDEGGFPVGLACAVSGGACSSTTPVSISASTYLAIRCACLSYSAGDVWTTITYTVD